MICGDESPAGRKCQLVPDHEGQHAARIGETEELERWGEPLPEPEPFEPPEQVEVTGWL